MSASSVFYHFIDARRRTDNRIDDFRAWLSNCGEQYTPLMENLAGIDPYFSTLTELRRNVAGAFQAFFQEDG